MNKFWIVIVGVILGTVPRIFAVTVKTEAPPKVEESSPDADKAAVHAASTEADQWAATKKSEPPKPVEKAEASESPAQAAKPAPKVAPAEAPAATPAPTPAAPAPAAHATYVPKPGLNEMKGKLASKSYDPKTLRLSVDGGYSVEFTFDKATILVNGGSPVTMDDFEYGDELIVRYAGKDLNAVEIDRTHKAPRPQ